MVKDFIFGTKTNIFWGYFKMEKKCLGIFLDQTLITVDSSMVAKE
jgi:hypothetical protein